MISRRDFLQTAAALGSTNFAWGVMPEVIARAASINPAKGTTFHDAEHVVILMQENRSFDHAFGALSGVRGFRDPRPHLQPNGNPVWFQPNSDGKFIPPFRLDMDGSNVTWIGGNPHSWGDQVDARNGGRYDNWLHAKGRSDHFPMTMGFFTREDIPFYYAFADAFTICDQAFCSSLTGTTPNRLFLWTGTIREDAIHAARVSNDDTDYGVEAAWTTFPERLEKAGISWRIYQNELSIESGLTGEGDAWLSNFTDNPIEWFTQFKVGFSKSRREFVKTRSESLRKQIVESESKLNTAGLVEKEHTEIASQIAKLKKELDEVNREMATYHEDAWNALSPHERALHEKAFSTNITDPDYRSLVEHDYMDGTTSRKIAVPKSDVLHQFRHDVEAGKLPAVSWLVAPERFSDHPGSAWFGAWYLSEILNILTKDPENWKKTVFILCYDENDGYFDHVPPFVAPHPNRPETGKVSPGIDTSVDVSNAHGRDHSIGLGFRVPLLIASPWTRGGCVNSQVCDHTSIIMFLETWLAGKGKPVHESNISAWRRMICGDLTSAFRPYNGEPTPLPAFLNRDAYIERIHRASFKNLPTPAAALESGELSHFKIAAFQENGTRPSCPLPYRIEGNLELGNNEVLIKLEALTSGCAFNAYSYGRDLLTRAYAVKPGDVLEDRIVTGADSHVRIDGPNGFLREVKSTGTAEFHASARSQKANLIIEVRNLGITSLELRLRDESYGAPEQQIVLNAKQSRTIRLSTKAGKHWYDFTVTGGGGSYRFAGRLETGNWSISDPAMA